MILLVQSFTACMPLLATSAFVLERRCWSSPQHLNNSTHTHTAHSTHTHTHTHLTALFPGLHGWDGTRNVKPIWILLKQETVSGSGISWAICKSAPCSRQITTPAPHRSVFYRPGALPVTQPTASKHWRETLITAIIITTITMIHIGVSIIRSKHTLWHTN